MVKNTNFMELSQNYYNTQYTEERNCFMQLCLCLVEGGCNLKQKSKHILLAVFLAVL